MKKQPETTEATKQTFIQVFCEFYMERPIEKITVKEISARAGYSRTTFYNYFKDPYDLLEYVENEFISHMQKEMVNNIRNDRTLGDFIVLFMDMIRSQELYSRILLNNPNNLQFANRMKNRLLPTVLEAFGISADNRKAQYLFEFYIPGMVAVVSRWMHNRDELTVEELAGIVEGILHNGVLPQLR